MKRLLIAPLIIKISSSSLALSQPIQIPVIPFDYKPHHVSAKIHRKCERMKTDNAYWRCIERSEKKIKKSFDIDFE